MRLGSHRGEVEAILVAAAVVADAIAVSIDVAAAAVAAAAPAAAVAIPHHVQHVDSPQLGRVVRIARDIEADRKTVGAVDRGGTYATARQGRPRAARSFETDWSRVGTDGSATRRFSTRIRVMVDDRA